MHARADGVQPARGLGFVLEGGVQVGDCVGGEEGAVEAVAEGRREGVVGGDGDGDAGGAGCHCGGVRGVR